MVEDEFTDKSATPDVDETDPFEDKSDPRLVEGGIYQCVKCDHRGVIKYEPPIDIDILHEDRVHDRIHCEKCNAPVWPMPEFVNKTWTEPEKELKPESVNKDLKPDLVEQATLAIMSKHRFLTVEETDQIWYYDNGVYEEGGEILIAKEAENLHQFELTKGKLSEITAHIRRRTYHKHEELDSNINIINIKNGLYHVREGKLTEHRPDYLSINQKKITYIEGAKPKRFVKFLQEVLYPRDIRTAVDALAYTFHRDYPIETIFMLYGLGANGKTVYTSVLSAIHGPDNVSNVPLTEMLGDKFALSDLENKDLNIDNELAGQTIKEAAVLKRLTGGSRQRIRIQRKNQRAYDTTLYAKLFFNANRIPDSQDTSDAYNRRLTIIPFPNRFEGATEDKQLLSKLTTDEEISGIFNMAMAALRGILRNKELYVNEKTIEEKRTKYERTVNPVKTFLEEAVSEYSTAADYVTKEIFYCAYEVYCNKYGLPVEKYDNFCKILKNRFEIQETRKEVEKGKDRVRCWAGILLTPDYAPKTEQTTIVL